MGARRLFPLTSRPLLLILVVASVLAPLTRALTYATDPETFAAPSFRDSQGPSEARRAGLAAYASARTDVGANASGATVRVAVLEVERAARENVTGIQDAVVGAGNATALLRAAHAQAHQAAMPVGQRTNLTLARAGLLADAVLALHADLGSPLTGSQELDVRAQASTLPASSAIAGAVAVYALIDAIHYSRLAYGGVDATALGRVRAQAADGAFASGSVTLDASQAGYTVSVEPTAFLDDLSNLTETTRAQYAYQAADVLAQAADEISYLTIVPPLSPQPSQACGSSVAFHSPNCLVVLGTGANGRYGWMEYPVSTRQMNSILIDFGGRDTYENHAGAGYTLSNLPVGCSLSEPGFQPPTCYTNLALHMDLGRDDDAYRAPRNSMSQWAQGAAFSGVGLLFDQGGNDRYNVTRTLSEGFGQAHATNGVALLVDASGDDVYEVWQREQAIAVRGQGAAMGNGLAILHDAGGNDQYYANVTPPAPDAPYAAGSYQASAASKGVAYLVDEGRGHDTFRAGQQYVQGAASLGGFAFLSDGGGDNRFTVVSALACRPESRASHFPPGLRARGCDPGDELVAVGGWSQGYADTGGFAAVALGDGRDTLAVLPLNPLAFGARENVGRLGSAGPGGVGILLDAGGDDAFAARGESVAFGDFGLGVFMDRGGNDEYGCASASCHARSSHEGVAVFYDGVSNADAFADGQVDPTRTTTWHQVSGGAALGLHVAPTGGGGGGGGGGLLDDRHYQYDMM